MNTKKTIILISAILIVNRAFSQESYALDSFELNGDGVIYVTDTDSVSGAIQYNVLASGHVSMVNTSGSFKSFKAKDIKGFKIQAPKRVFYSVKSDGLDQSIMFYEDITPDGGKKLLLLKAFFQDGILIVGGTVKGKWESQPYSIAHHKLIGSNFKKIAEMLQDCPTLSEKISKKQKGYYFGVLSLPPIQNQVYNTIVTEYNACP